MSLRSSISHPFYLGPDDDDDEDCIVYGKEATEEKSRFLASTFQDPTKEHSQHKDEGLPSPSLNQSCIPRHERRKRRQEWRDRQRWEQAGGLDQNLEDEDLAGGSSQTGKDALAKLESLLDASQESAPSPQKQASPRKGLVEQDLKKSTPKHDSVSEDSKPPDPSPPEFTFHHDDFEDSIQETPLDKPAPSSLRRRRHSSQDKVSGGKIRKKSKSRQSRSDDRGSTPSSVSFTKKRRLSSTHLSLSSSQPRVTPRSLPRMVTQMTEDDTNLVGIRPTHWGRRSSIRSLDQAAAKRIKCLSGGKQSVLRAGTRITPQTRTISKRVRSTSMFTQNPKSTETNTNPPGTLRKRLDPKKLDFRPSFAPARKTQELLDVPIDEVENSENLPLQSPLGDSRSTPPSSSIQRTSTRKRKTRGGPWTTRFANLQSDRRTDAMRLQHPGMNRPGAFDFNDPRKKANSYTDITVLGDCSIFGMWNGASTGGAAHPNTAVMTVLGFVHQHQSSRTGNDENDVDSSKCFFSWISFNVATGRSISLKTDMQLRLYNAILLPICDNGSATPTLPCRHTILCTQLCEPYPRHLPPLAPVDVSSLWTAEESTS